MIRELTCVTCPMGCSLSIESGEGDDLVITGNRCPRGVVYAREELLAPKRVVTATCRLRFPEATPSEAGLPHAAMAFAGLPRRLPIKSTAAFPRERIPELLGLIAELEVPAPVHIGDLLAKDLLGTGIDLVATRTVTW